METSANKDTSKAKLTRPKAENEEQSAVAREARAAKSKAYQGKAVTIPVPNSDTAFDAKYAIRELEDAGSFAQLV